jgi:Zn finger protein HypA/HybF involved in hydrogenase expression
MNYNGITKTNDRRFEHSTGWVWCNCVNCGVWHKKWRPTTADGLCPKCKEEMREEMNKRFYSN